MNNQTPYLAIVYINLIALAIQLLGLFVIPFSFVLFLKLTAIIWLTIGFSHLFGYIYNKLSKRS